MTTATSDHVTPEGRPLSGMRVLELGVFIAGPGASSILASLGADVIKIEHVNGDQSRQLGDGGRGMVQAYNRGKRSIAVDLQSPEGMELLHRAVRTADVFVHNMRPASAERLGIAAPAIRKVNPSIVHGSINGYGSETSQRDRTGLDISAQAESGMMSINGEADHPPVRVGFTVVDATTAHVLVQGILAALLARERTGQGATVEAPLLHVATHLNAPLWAEYFASGQVPMRKGNGQPGLAPAADLYRTKDGHIVLSAYTAAHWQRLCDVIGQPELVDDPRFATNPARVAHRPELAAVLERVFTTMPSEDCADWLSSHGIVAGPVRTFDQAFDASIAHELGVFEQGTDGQWYVTTPYRVNGRLQPNPTAVPAIGQHTHEVLDELGYAEEEINQFLEDGIVRATAADPLPARHETETA